MIRINRYDVRGKWYWRVWSGDRLIAKCARSYTDTDLMERELHLLFPRWIK